MTHTYKIAGMTCNSCVAKVKSALLSLPHILAVDVSKELQQTTITMDKHIDIQTLQNALAEKYTINANDDSMASQVQNSWWVTYKPVLLVFIYILIVALVLAWSPNGFDVMKAMTVFMAGFFLVFSFFKMLNLQAFANSYSMYDIVAKRFAFWGYIYAFIELGLGIAYLVNFAPVVTNMITLVVMSISIIGVLQTVFNKRKIQCACLGTVFNLPMSTITIVEDALMIAMSISMLLMLL